MPAETLRRTEAKAYFGALQQWPGVVVRALLQPDRADTRHQRAVAVTLIPHLGTWQQHSSKHLTRSSAMLPCLLLLLCHPPPHTRAANERTFLHWMNVSVTIGSISAALSGEVMGPSGSRCT
jgi:hypothetical protein